MSEIGFYKSVIKVEGEQALPLELDNFLEDVRKGTWQDPVLFVRKITDKKERDAQKKKLLSAVTLSGIFRDRTDASLVVHSGFIVIDIDNEDNPGLANSIEELKEEFRKDEFVYSAFTSCSGLGLCLVFKIEGNKHREAFLALSAYVQSKYRLVVDPTGVNESRMRFVSFDPFLYLNDKAKLWKKYLPKEEKKKDFEQPIFVENDFEQMLIALAPYNDCDDYRVWMSFGYALADKFGEAGLNYFHIVSRTSSKYDYNDCEKKYKAILRTLNDNKKQAKIATIYWYAKKHNVPFYTQRTKNIVNTARQLKNSGIGAENAVKAMEMDGIPATESKLVVDNVFINERDDEDKDSQITRVKNWLRFNYKFRRNTFTMRVEVDGKPIDDNIFNSIFVAAREIFDKKVTSEELQRIIESNFSADYNPFQEFFQKNKNIECEGTIQKYIECFEIGEENKDMFERFLKSWLVGVMSSIHGQHSPLVLVLIGGINTGKTEALRRLLPIELKDYYAESSLDAGKDDWILMCQKLIIMDDEFGGKSKYENKQFKNLTSKQTFSLRAPYGKYNVDMKRVACLCGTANEKEVLVDSTGNRRILPVNVISIDFEKINEINRIALFMDAYRLYKEGYKWQLGKADIEEMSKKNYAFEEHCTEYELINQYYKIPEDEETPDLLTATEIKVFLENKSNQKINLTRIGQQLGKIGFAQRHEQIPGTRGGTRRVWAVVKINSQNDLTNNDGYKPISKNGF